MATLRSDEAERFPLIELEMVSDDGRLLASITVSASDEDQLSIVVERHEDDPSVSMTVV